MGNGKLSIHIPAINPATTIKAPLYTQKMTMRFITVSSAFEGMPQMSDSMETYRFNYSHGPIPAKDIIIDTNASADQVTVLAMALEFDNTVGKLNREVNWLPAAVIAIGKMNV